MNFYYKFELKPMYVIFSVRKGSPAADVGLLKDDIIISINNKESHLFSLQEINNLLKSEEGKRIKMEIQRQNQIIKFNFVLKSIF
jgi:C-terminal processing protease CtpA/Prc